MTKHISIIPSSDVLRSPVTEVLLAYFPMNYSQPEKDTAATQRQDILSKYFSCSDITSLSHGWSVENDFPVRGKKTIDGRLGAALMGFIGWSSNIAQASFRQTSAYKEALSQIQGINRLLSLDIISLRCNYLERYKD